MIILKKFIGSKFQRIKDEDEANFYSKIQRITYIIEDFYWIKHER